MPLPAATRQTIKEANMQYVFLEGYVASFGCLFVVLFIEDITYASQDNTSAGK
jgi:hypothetical protein